MQPPSPGEVAHEPANTIILIGGSARAAAMDARRGGFNVIAVDCFGDLDLLANCLRWIKYDDEDCWLDELLKLPAAIVVPLGGFDWPSAERAGRLLRHHLVAYPDPATLDRLRDPRCLAAVAARAGVSFPETHCSDLVLPTHHGWLLKPRKSGGGIGIRLAVEKTLPNDAVYLQRRIYGKLIGANFLSTHVPTGDSSQTRLLGLYGGLLYRHNRSHPFLYGGSYGPLPCGEQIRSNIVHLGQVVAAEFSLSGLFNIDFIVGRDGRLWLLEINPRYSASMELIPLACQETSLVQMHVDSYRGFPSNGGLISQGFTLQDSPDYPVADRPFACKRIRYHAESRTDSRFVAWLAKNIQDSTSSLTWQQGLVPPRESLPLAQSHNLRLYDLPSQADKVSSGEPVCTSIAHGLWADRVHVMRAAKMTPS